MGIEDDTICCGGVAGIHCIMYIRKKKVRKSEIREPYEAPNDSIETAFSTPFQTPELY